MPDNFIRKVIKMPDGTYRIVFIDPQTGKMRYSLPQKSENEGLADGSTFIESDPSNRNRFDFYTYSSEDGQAPAGYIVKGHPSFQANDSVRNLIESKIKPVTKQSIGGTMNYYNYLQDGGQIEDQITKLVLAALSGDQSANDQIEKIMQAAQQGDQKAQQVAQIIQQIVKQLQVQEEQPETMKCGGKVRAKIKKAACGKKLEQGAEIKKASKGCACQLKKVGGRLIEVDGCTGLPINNK